VQIALAAPAFPKTAAAQALLAVQMANVAKKAFAIPQVTLPQSLLARLTKRVRAVAAIRSKLMIDSCGCEKTAVLNSGSVHRFNDARFLFSLATNAGSLSRDLTEDSRHIPGAVRNSKTYGFGVYGTRTGCDFFEKTH